MMADAMDRMGKGMAIAHSGNPDRDFAAMMIPHHQAAVAMAETELKYGNDPRVKALAKGVISEQQKEIRKMQSWLK